MKKLYIISSGAGGSDYLTSEAIKALKDCEVVVSYTKYAKEIQEFIQDKELYTSGMTYEIQRCQMAIDFAKQGKTTCIISNGDVNVFGMATLVVELLDEQNLWEDIEVVSIAGVTSFLAAASQIGAPISQDFAVISLSDRLTDINLIDKRIKNSLECDMILGIYNPKSKTRTKPYENFLNALANESDKIIIIASNIGRVEQKVIISSSKELIKKGIANDEIGMNCLIIVSNSTTKITKNNLVLTPRGYLNKYDLDGNILSPNDR